MNMRRTEGARAGSRVRCDDVSGPRNSSEPMDDEQKRPIEHNPQDLSPARASGPPVRHFDIVAI
jgi:hypothetical protein